MSTLRQILTSSTPIKRGWPKGKKFSAEHRAAISRGHRNSKIAKRHIKRIMKMSRTKPVALKAANGRMATMRLRQIGLTKDQAPKLWQSYRDFYRRRRESRAV